MRGFLTYLTTSAAAAVLTAGLIAGSAGFARAQSAYSTGEAGGHGGASVATQAAKTINFEGCWDGSSIVGSLEDEEYGSGYGWIGIIQGGNKIKGNDESGYEFVWDGGNDWAYGPIKGKAGSTGFSASGSLGGKCKIKIVGHPGGSDNIVGTYTYTGCTIKKNDFINTHGTFNLPLNDSGCSDIIP
jgi:hypothetical protein